MCKDYLIAHPLTSVEMDTAEGIIIEERRTSIAVVLLQHNDEIGDCVVSVGEALCNPKDSFNKDLGTKIAVNRAKHADNHGANQWKLSEIENMIEYEGEESTMSSATTPITGTPMPYGLVNRIRMLIPRS